MALYKCLYYYYYYYYYYKKPARQSWLVDQMSGTDSIDPFLGINSCSCLPMGPNDICYEHCFQFLCARCNIYISRLCYDVSVRVSVRLSVTEVHWRIMANLGFKFRSHVTAHSGFRAACGRLISRHAI